MCSTVRKQRGPGSLKPEILRQEAGGVRPHHGDELQGIKRGVVEFADLVLVDKAAGELDAAARRSVTDYASALELIRPPLAEWQVPVRVVSALEGTDIQEAWDDVQRLRAMLGAMVRDRQQPSRALSRRSHGGPAPRRHRTGGHGRHGTPTAAARKLMAAFRRLRNTAVTAPPIPDRRTGRAVSLAAIFFAR